MLGVKSFRSNCIDFINKDDCWLFLSCERKCVSNHFGSISNIHLNKLWASKLEKGGFSLCSASSGHHCLSSTRRPVEKYTFRWANANIIKSRFSLSNRSIELTFIYESLEERSPQSALKSTCRVPQYRNTNQSASHQAPLL